VEDWPARPVAYEVNTAVWLNVTGWPDNQSCRNLAAWSWDGDGGHRHVVVVNPRP
jgi:hypothetical protein